MQRKYLQLGVTLLLIWSILPCSAATKKIKLKDIKADIDMIYSDESYLYRYPASPALNDRVTIKLRTKKNDIDNVTILYKIAAKESSLMMKKIKSDNYFDYFIGMTPEITGETTYYFQLAQGTTTFYYARNGISVKAPSTSFKFKIFPGFTTPDWMRGAVLYQIYTDRFYNGDKNNDVVTNEYMYDNYPAISKKWDDLPDSARPYDQGSDRTREFFGGDIEGVIQKLPYLKSLGVDGIYFNPLFVSPSNHKYDAQDYENIDPHFGTIIDDDPTLIDPKKDPGYGSADMNRSSPINKDAKKYITRVTSQKNLDASNAKLKELITKANNLGIKVILDGVFNHCGSFNKWFDREHLYPEAGAYESKDSPYNNFFTFTKDEWPNNENYENWWGYKTLPKLNYEGSDQLVNSIMNVAQKWIDSGVYGWRLDVASDLGHTAKYNHQFWEKLRTAVKKENPNAVIFAEIYGDASSWLKGNEWDTIMNYDAFFEPVSFFFTGMEKHSYSYNGKLHNNVTEFDKIMKETMAKMPWQSLEIAMNQLDNHDHSRFITRTNGMIDEGKDDNVRKPELADKNINKGILKEAVVFQMTWMGAPTLYYGNEAGLVGWTDPDDRRTYPWGKEDKELLEFYKEIIQLHKSYSSISNGGTVTLITDDTNKIYSYGRWNDKDLVVVGLNNDAAPHQVTIDGTKMGLDKEMKLDLVFTSNKNTHAVKKETVAVDNKGQITVTIEPFGSVVLAKTNFTEEWIPSTTASLKVIAVSPENSSEISKSDSITFEMSDVVDKTTIEEGISVTPGTDLVFAVNGKYVTIKPKKQWKKGNYTIELHKSLQSLYGNFPLSSSYQLQFTVTK